MNKPCFFIVTRHVSRPEQKDVVKGELIELHPRFAKAIYDSFHRLKARGKRTTIGAVVSNFSEVEKGCTSPLEWNPLKERYQGFLITDIYRTTETYVISLEKKVATFEEHTP